MEAHEWRAFFNSLPNMPTPPDTTPEPEKPRLRLVLCDLGTGRCLADAKLDQMTTITGDLFLMLRTIQHLATILPNPTGPNP